MVSNPDTPRRRMIAVLAVLGGLLSFFLTAAGCSPETGTDSETRSEEEVQTAEAPVVYGVDRRQDVYAHSDPSLQALAEQSTVTIMSQSTVDASDPNNIQFTGPTLGAQYNLCSPARFYNDPVVGNASGTLIDSDLVLTAGHVLPMVACADMKLVFNFRRDSAITRTQVTHADVFQCASVVASYNANFVDYAVIKLDRPATPRFTPVNLRRAKIPMAAGQRVGLIGSPNGIPTKIDSGGQVRDPRTGSDYFIATTDSFSGNSGSGVFELSSYNQVGMLIAGDPEDYVGSGDGCNTPNFCAESACSGEYVIYIGAVLDAYCATAAGPSNARLCGPLLNVFSFSASSTASANVRTTNQFVALYPGQSVTVSTYGDYLSIANGDTYLRLVDPTGDEVAANDNAPAGGSLGAQLFYAVPANAVGGLYQIRAGCAGSATCSGTASIRVNSSSSARGGSFSYTRSPGTTEDLTVHLRAGESLLAGTCGLDGAGGSTYANDPYLQILDPASNVVLTVDDTAGCGHLSKIDYTAGSEGDYKIRVGCHLPSQTCSGTLSYLIQGRSVAASNGSFLFSEAYTNSAQVNTTNRSVVLMPGQTISLGTCDVAGATAGGDTYLWLFGPSSMGVAYDDDTCGGGGGGSYLSYTVPPGMGGSYEIRAGCYHDNACNGTVAYTVTGIDAWPACGGTYFVSPRHAPQMHLSTSAAGGQLTLQPGSPTDRSQVWLARCEGNGLISLANTANNVMAEATWGNGGSVHTTALGTASNFSKWSLGSDEGYGFHAMRPISDTGQNMDANGGYSGPGTTVITYGWQSGYNQQWRFLPTW